MFRRKKSKDKLKERLKLILTYDKAQLSPVQMESLKEELIAVVKNYFPMDQTDIDVQVERESESVRVVARLSCITIQMHH